MHIARSCHLCLRRPQNQSCEETDVLLRLAANKQNGANFRSAEASRPKCSPTPLVQTSDYRHDTDHDNGGRQCARCTHGSRLQSIQHIELQQSTKYNNYQAAACFGRIRSPPRSSLRAKLRRSATTKPGLAEVTSRLELTIDAPGRTAS